MDIYQHAMACTEALAQHHGRSAAMLWQASTPQGFALASSIDVSAHHGTAIVNLLQSPGGLARLDKCWISVNVPPTAACIGMSKLLGISRIYFRAPDGKGMLFDVAGLVVQKGQIKAQWDKKTDYDGPEGDPPPQWAPVFPVVNNSIAGPAASIVNDLVGADDIVKDNTAMLLAFSIAEAAHGTLRNNPRRSGAFQGQNVASVMTTGDHTLVAWGLNTNVAHPTFHGEVNIIRGYQQSTGVGGLPANGKLFSTLEPCVMCSGMIVHCAGANPFAVVSGQKDEQVAISALRTGGRTDGATGIPRNVSAMWSHQPLLHGNRTLADSLLGAQKEVSKGRPRLKQTTVFLEEDAGQIFGDAHRLLLKTAAMWLPEASRAPWRAKVETFLDGVQAIVR